MSGSIDSIANVQISKFRAAVGSLISAEKSLQQTRKQRDKARKDYHGLSREEQESKSGEARRSALDRQEKACAQAEAKCKAAQQIYDTERKELSVVSSMVTSELSRAQGNRSKLNVTAKATTPLVSNQRRAASAADKQVRKLTVLLERINKALKEAAEQISRVRNKEGSQAFLHDGSGTSLLEGTRLSASDGSGAKIYEGFAGSTIVEYGDMPLLVCSNCHEAIGGEASIYKCPTCGRQTCVKCRGRCRSCAERIPPRQSTATKSNGQAEVNGLLPDLAPAPQRSKKSDEVITDGLDSLINHGYLTETLGMKKYVNIYEHLPIDEIKNITEIELIHNLEKGRDGYSECPIHPGERIFAQRVMGKVCHVCGETFSYYNCSECNSTGGVCSSCGKFFCGSCGGGVSMGGGRASFVCALCKHSS